MERRRLRGHRRRARSRLAHTATSGPLPRRRSRSLLPGLRGFSRAARASFPTRVPAPRGHPGLVDPVSVSLFISVPRRSSPPRGRRCERALRGPARARRGHAPDVQPASQFGAVTFVDEAGASYVVFRGTDASAVGWAEDARFALDFPTDSQRWAANYLEYAASRADGPITVIGHSKGANLALYAAAAASPPALERVYAFDPVGFPASVVEGGFFESIDGLMHIYVTAGSWVSPLLPLPAPATVVASRWPGPLSHNPYAWRVEGPLLAPDHRPPSRSGRFLRALLSALLRARPTRIGTK